MKSETGMTFKLAKISFPKRKFSVENIRGVPLAFLLLPHTRKLQRTTLIYLIYPR